MSVNWLRTIATVATCLIGMGGHSMAAEDYSWRASVTSERAMRIAGALFPEQCSSYGELCGITYDDRRACPFEFMVIFPKGDNGPNGPRMAWVTLDKNGGVTDVSTSKKKSCRNVRS
jgi:hypothetical protein